MRRTVDAPVQGQAAGGRYSHLNQEIVMIPRFSCGHEKTPSNTYAYDRERKIDAVVRTMCKTCTLKRSRARHVPSPRIKKVKVADRYAKPLLAEVW